MSKELVRKVSVAVDVDTNKGEYEKTFIQDEDESVDSFLLRVRQWLVEYTDELNE